PELGGLVAVGVGNEDPGAAAVQRPGLTAVNGAVQPVVDVLRAARPATRRLLPEVVDVAGRRVTCEPVAGFHSAPRGTDQVVPDEVGRLGAGRDRNSHVRAAVEVVVRHVRVVLSSCGGVAVHHEPGLVDVV